MSRRALSFLLSAAVVASGVAAIMVSLAGPAAAATFPGTYVAKTPVRLLDTRNDLGGSPLGPSGTLTLQIGGVGTLPASSQTVQKVFAVLFVIPEGNPRLHRVQQ